MIIDGQKIAKEIIGELKKKPRPGKFLAAFLIDDDSSSISFLKQKENVAQELGIDFRLYRLPAGLKQDELRKKISKTAQHKNCGGAIVQLPLPEHINEHYVCNVIPQEKDVDVLGERALGAFYNGRNPVLPPAVGVVEEIIKNLKLEIRNFRAAVIGRGTLIGRPVSLWLSDKVAELQIFASRTEDLNKKLREINLVVSGVGQAHRFSAADLEENAVVIDFGYNFKDKKILGDFTAPPEPSLITYTPTPGGTGPILVARLFENFYNLNS